ncbi:hypothetical protein HDV02_001398 [Globomyces sp. JEL0801]|nr:hypothetical protein HDV02_001398 [Globomyces sp. JEL0801]
MYSLMDGIGYIKPSLQNFLLTDIDSKVMESIAFDMELEYLGIASFPGSFPVEGGIWTSNHRLMVNLVCQTKSDCPSRNIIFVVNTGSPYTYLCQEAMESLVGKDCKLPQTLYVKIHTGQVIQTYISPKDSNFANVNVLGMDFLYKNKLNLVINWTEKTFSLDK